LIVLSVQKAVSLPLHGIRQYIFESIY
jgi:hypothetical protein